MKKKDKSYEKLKERMRKLRSGDGDELIYNPFEKQIASLLSLGKSKGIKSVKMSSKKRVGDIVNKNIHRRYSSVEKTLERMKKNREKIW